MASIMYDELLQTAKEHSENVVTVCGAVLSLIVSKLQEEQVPYFETFLKELTVADLEIPEEERFYAPMFEQNISVKDREADNLGGRLIANLIQANVSEEDFYADLWKRLMDDVVSGDDASKTILLVRFWSDPRIPYYHLEEGCAMENEEFQAILRSIEPQIQKSFFIVHAGLPQKTQKTSLLMKLAAEIKDERQQAAFWAVVFDQEMMWRSRLAPPTGDGE